MERLTGTRTLLRLALRRDRILLPAWIYVVAAMVIATGASIGSIYPTAASREKLASGIGSNPATLGLYGPVYDSSLGSLVAWRTGTVALVAAALMSIVIVVRHTRGDEEVGRTELIGSAVVGRYAPLATALIVAVLANLAAAALLAVGLVVIGRPVAGTILFAAGIAATGLVFTAVAALTAQLAPTARGATGLASGVLGLGFLLRAVADAGGSSGPTWLGWASPLGWASRTRAFADARWWPLAISLVAAVALVAAAAATLARRDLGAGLLPQRPGPAGASRRLATPLALAWRLQRTALLGWTAGFALTGVLVGSIARDIGEFTGTKQVQDLLEALGGSQGVTDAYYATTFSIMALLAGAYAVQATLRLRAEEQAGRVEPLLATAVGRGRWAAGHLLIAVGGAAVLLLVLGLGAGLADGIRGGDVSGRIVELLGAAAVQIPAAWILAGATFLLFGTAPRAAVGGWAALVVFLLLGQIGAILKLPGWLLDASPFSHVPQLPGGAFSVAPLLGLLAVGAALLAAGFARFRLRDVG